MSALLQTPDILASVVWFGVAICLIDAFDISLPRGDSFGVSGALIAAGFSIFEGFAAAIFVVVSVVALLIAHLLRQRGRLGVATLHAVAIRLFSLLALLFTLAVVDATRLSLPVALVAILSAGGFLGFELIAAQVWLAVKAKRPLIRLLRGNIQRQTPVIAAQVSVSALIVVTYPSMQAWVLLPVTAMLLLIRQSYALLLQMRETYRTTVEVLVEAAEDQDSRLKGHSERSAQIARSICMKMGMAAHHVERASYAALLHNVGAIAEERSEHGACVASSEVLEGVTFLSDVIPIMRLCDGAETSDSLKEVDSLVAVAVGLACEIDTRCDFKIRSVHSGTIFKRVTEEASSTVKARVVAAALELGYEIPAVS